MIASLKWVSRCLHDVERETDRKGVLKSLGRSLLMTIGKQLQNVLSAHEISFINLPHVYSRLLLVGGPAGRYPGMSLAQPGYPELSHHALLAGAVGGYIVWGRYSAVNYQILLYLSSRVIVALGKRTLFKGERKPHPWLYSMFAAAVWGLAVALFEESPDVLHPSLKSSMDEIYRFQLNTARENRQRRNFVVSPARTPVV
jgi:hypothetical protein